MDDPSIEASGFDHYANDYDAALAEGLSASGEGKDYFCRGRVLWLANCLRRLQEKPQAVMDFGCGTGSATPYLIDLIGARSTLGLDNSAKSIELARRLFGSENVSFLPLNDYEPHGDVDLVYCNGVFHHIPLEQRSRAIDYVHRSLRLKGLFAFWENNPWNPGTRYIMSKIPFDRDAITLNLLEAGRLLQAGGFEILRKDFLFVFPRALKYFRVIEPFVSKLPLGGQYQILCRKL